MWGNRLGWGISGFIVLLFVGIGWLIQRAGATSAPSAFSVSDPILSAPLKLPVDPQTIVTFDAPGVAGPLYRKAIDDYLANRSQYETLLRDRAPDLEKLLAGHQALIDATALSQMDLFAQTPDEVVSYRSEMPELTALSQVAQSLNLLALRNEKAGNTDRALKYYEATFALGAKLYQERVSYAELSVGLGLMATGAMQIGKLDANRAEAAKAFTEAYADYSPKLAEVQKKINSIDRKYVYKYAGDVYAVAQSPQFDNMWRVEAMLKLGRYRFDASPLYPGDQRRALPVVRRYLNDPNPAIASAAKQAAGLDEVSYRKLGG